MSLMRIFPEGGVKVHPAKRLLDTAQWCRVRNALVLGLRADSESANASAYTIDLKVTALHG